MVSCYVKWMVMLIMMVCVGIMLWCVFIVWVKWLLIGCMIVVVLWLWSWLLLLWLF